MLKCIGRRRKRNIRDKIKALFGQCICFCTDGESLGWQITVPYKPPVTLLHLGHF